MKNKSHSKVANKTKNVNSLIEFIFLKLLVFIILICPQTVHTQGRMVMYLPFDGNANDATGNGHNGRVNGPVLTTDRFGKPASAYTFDGINDFIQIPHSPELRADRTTPISLCVWVNFCEKQTDYAGIVCKGSKGTPYPGQQLVVREGYRIEGELSTGDRQVLSIGNAFSRYNDGFWHFIAMIVNSRTGEFSVYIDGKKDATITSQIFDPSIDDMQSPMYVGVERNLKNYFKGAIDDIRIYNYPLLINEIKFLYEEGGYKPSNSRGASYNVKICSQDAKLIADSGYVSYKWSNGEFGRAIKVFREGVYTVQKSNPNGCTITDTFYVKLGELKFETEQTSPNVKCLGQKISFRVKNLLGSAPFKFIWTRITDGLNEVISGDSNVTFVMQYPSEKITIDIYDNNGCRALATIFTSVDNPTSVNVLPSRSVSICGGNSTELKIVLSRNNGGYKYEWSPASGLNTTVSDVVRASPTTSTLYKIKITDPSGCEFYDSVFVKINNKMRLNYPNKNMCTGEFALLDGTVDSGTAPYKYSWTPTTYLDNPNSKNPKATPPTSMKYVCTITDSNGCTATTVVSVNVSNREVSLVQEPNNIIDLGKVEESFVKCRNIKLSNSTNATLTISNARFAGKNNFYLASKTLPISIPPLGLKDFAICYMPLKTGVLRDTLLLDLKGSCNPTMIVIADVFFSETVGKDCSLKYLKVPKDGYQNLLKVSPVILTNSELKIKIAYAKLLAESINFEVFDMNGKQINVGSFSQTSQITADIFSNQMIDEKFIQNDQHDIKNPTQASTDTGYMVEYNLGDLRIPYKDLPTKQGVYFVKILCGGLVKIVKVMK